MRAWRSLLRTHRHIALLGVVLALLMRAALPAGAMLATVDTVLTVTVCADASGGGVQTRHIVLPREPRRDGAGSDRHEQGIGAGTCPFAALSMASLDPTDPEMLAVALAFVVALGFAAMPPLRLGRQAHRRPPLRGPPLRT